MTADADSAIAIWDSLKSSSDILVRHNLITGGGFAIYAEDYDPGDGGPGDPSAVGGFTDTEHQLRQQRVQHPCQRLHRAIWRVV